MLGGISIGWHMLPPEKWMAGAMCASLMKFFEVLERAIAPATVEVAHERRTAHRREHRGIPSDAHAALGIARVHGELGGRGRKQAACHATRDMNALILYIRPASRHRRSDSGSRRSSMPISSRMVSAFASMISTASELRSSTGGRRLECRMFRAARLRARPPDIAPAACGRSSVMCALCHSARPPRPQAHDRSYVRRNHLCPTARCAVR